MKLGVVLLARSTAGCSEVTNREGPSEASRVAWLAPAEAVAAMPEARAVRISDALRSDGPFVRVHDGDVLLDTD
jgi:8-oxo-dGTP diphosphatase